MNEKHFFQFMMKSDLDTHITSLFFYSYYHISLNFYIILCFLAYFRGFENKLFFLNTTFTLLSTEVAFEYFEYSNSSGSMAWPFKNFELCCKDSKSKSSSFVSFSECTEAVSFRLP